MIEEYRMAGNVFMADKWRGYGVDPTLSCSWRIRGRPDVKFDGWCEGGLGLQKDDGGD